MENYMLLFLYGLLCAAVGFLAAIKLYEESEKSTENLLQAHRDYEEALHNGYIRAMKIIDEQNEFISRLVGGFYDNSKPGQRGH